MHRTIIVPASHVGIARELTEAADPAGAGMFTTKLSATGDLPASHFISSGFIREQYALILDEKDAALVQAISDAAGIGYTQEQIDELLSLIDVSSEDAFAALNRLGLRICREVE
ncbi:hypothetical protein [Nitrosomonas sp. Nm34]|uniref:hypothetical protein n=1 Tax=Nitrosomonas sp. Nm34 TaxID=1881055 RepID=UPI0011146C8E|nr:hypothetical protein [Nitrosomonas sp. Nm34]